MDSGNLRKDSQEGIGKMISIMTRPSGRYHLYRQLWGLRGSGENEISGLLMHGQTRARSTHLKDANLSHTIEAAMCQVELPFSTDPELQSDYVGIDGGTRFGKILEDLDVLAATVAYLHCGTTGPDGLDKRTIVTAAVDRIDIYKPEAFESICGTDLRLRALPTGVGGSSMECTVLVEKRLAVSDKKWDIVAIARFIMVSRTADGRSALPIPKIQPRDTNLQRLLLDFGERRRQARQTKLHSSLSKQPPTADESVLLHEMYKMTTVSGAVRISNTRCQRIQICQPQERNIHNFIFGGFLMREAFDLAHACAALFFKLRPDALVQLIGMDDFAFKHPVPIGSILEFTAEVVFSQITNVFQVIHLEVKADIVDAASGTRTTTNTFHFTFRAKKRADSLATICPESYSDAMRYLEGRRRVMSYQVHDPHRPNDFDLLSGTDQ